jgi:Tfp pilus assembly protein PilO
MVMNDLKAVSIVPKEREPGQYIDWSPFDMNLKGNFTGFVTFLKDLEQLGDAVDVSGIQIASSGVKSFPLAITFTLKI